MIPPEAISKLLKEKIELCSLVKVGDGVGDGVMAVPKIEAGKSTLVLPDADVGLLVGSLVGVTVGFFVGVGVGEDVSVGVGVEVSIGVGSFVGVGNAVTAKVISLSDDVGTDPVAVNRLILRI